MVALQFFSLLHHLLCTSVEKLVKCLIGTHEITATAVAVAMFSFRWNYKIVWNALNDYFQFEHEIEMRSEWMKNKKKRKNTKKEDNATARTVLMESCVYPNTFACVLCALGFHSIYTEITVLLFSVEMITASSIEYTDFRYTNTFNASCSIRPLLP